MRFPLSREMNYEIHTNKQRLIYQKPQKLYGTNDA